VRVLAFLLLLILIPAVVFGIAYVPRHDGAWLDLVLAVLLPTLGISWCLWQLVDRPS
jgi:peptidoglycan/LPS O-acetylase OafA/YrhL